jgi:hypothetical protein
MRSHFHNDTSIPFRQAGAPIRKTLYFRSNSTAMQRFCLSWIFFFVQLDPFGESLDAVLQEYFRAGVIPTDKMRSIAAKPWNSVQTARQCFAGWRAVMIIAVMRDQNGIQLRNLFRFNRHIDQQRHIEPCELLTTQVASFLRTPSLSAYVFYRQREWIWSRLKRPYPIAFLGPTKK